MKCLYPWLPHRFVKNKVAPLYSIKTYIESRGISPLILNLSMRQRWVVSFTPQPLYLQRKYPGIHWIVDWMGPRAGLDVEKKRTISCPCQASNPWSPSPCVHKIFHVRFVCPFLCRNLKLSCTFSSWHLIFWWQWQILLWLYGLWHHVVGLIGGYFFGGTSYLEDVDNKRRLFPGHNFK